jgi:pre-rRNA-processing protein TSR2
MWIECVKRTTGQLQLAEGQEGAVEKFERMAQKARNDDADPNRALRATRARNQGGNGEDEDDDSSSGSEDDMQTNQSNGMDVDMNSAPTQRREKEEPIVDEDGFTMVPSKKGRR